MSAALLVPFLFWALIGRAGLWACRRAVKVDVALIIVACCFAQNTCCQLQKSPVISAPSPGRGSWRAADLMLGAVPGTRWLLYVHWAFLPIALQTAQEPPPPWSLHRGVSFWVLFLAPDLPHADPAGMGMSQSGLPEHVRLAPLAGSGRPCLSSSIS